jgi:CrcB protein
MWRNCLTLRQRPSSTRQHTNLYGGSMQRIFLTQFMLVGFGGFIGSGLRFTLQSWVQRTATFTHFPLGTLSVNVLGCLLIGYLGGLAEHRQALDASMRLFLLVGVLGGFTTFSTFAYESLLMAQTSQFFGMLLNVLLQVTIGFSAAWVGMTAARLL